MFIAMPWSFDLSESWFPLVCGLGICSGLLMFWTYKRTRVRILKYAAFLAGMTSFVLGIFLVEAYFVLTTLFVQASSKVIISPDLHYAARVVEINGGATEPLRTAVKLKSRSGFWGDTVFFGDFASDELEVSWLDKSHLRIRFPEEDYPWNRPVNCDHSRREIEISCEVQYPLAKH
jgi:hypothetical protein